MEVENGYLRQAVTDQALNIKFLKDATEPPLGISKSTMLLQKQRVEQTISTISNFYALLVTEKKGDRGQEYLIQQLKLDKKELGL